MKLNGIIRVGKVSLLCIALTSCALSLTPKQERKFNAMETQGVVVEEKSPAVGVMLGFLPGGGSFYIGRPGLGVVNFLSWPLSICWDPINGYNGSRRINYEATLYDLKKKRQKEEEALDEKQISSQISHEEYEAEMRKVAHKYEFQ
jgi:hypothetical protein